MSADITTMYAVTETAYRGDDRVIAVIGELESAERLEAVAFRNNPDAGYRTAAVPVLASLPEPQPLYQLEATISPDQIGYDEFVRIEGAYALGWPGLNHAPTAGEIEVEDIVGGTPGTKSILVRGWDRAKVEERLHLEAERIQAEMAEQEANRPPWACPTCGSSDVLVRRPARRLVAPAPGRVAAVIAEAEPVRLRCERGHTYGVPEGVLIEGL